MNPYKISTRNRASLVGLLTFLQLVPLGCNVIPIEPQLREQSEDFEGSIDFATEKPTPFELRGSEPDIGDYTAHGEVIFHEGPTPGSLIGAGVAVFTTTDGSKLVADVTWPVDAEGGDMRESNIQFHWRDTVQFSDGTVAESNGRFADPANRPQGLVVIAIIAILIGLLLPAVQKVR